MADTEAERHLDDFSLIPPEFKREFAHPSCRWFVGMWLVGAANFLAAYGLLWLTHTGLIPMAFVTILPITLAMLRVPAINGLVPAVIAIGTTILAIQLLFLDEAPYDSGWFGIPLSMTMWLGSVMALAFVAARIARPAIAKLRPWRHGPSQQS